MFWLGVLCRLSGDFMKLQKMAAGYFFFLCLVFGSVAIGRDACSAADWAQWRGPQRDGKSTEKGLLKSWPAEGPKFLWSVDGLGMGFSTAVVADGLVYTTGLIDTEGMVFAFDLQGGQKWKKSYGPGWAGSHPGARTTPTVDSESLYVISGVGTVVSFDSKTGRKRWSVDTLKRFGGLNVNWGISESVLTDGDKVICTPGGEDATVVALDKRSGETVWTSKGLSDKSGYCSAILVERGGKRLIVTITGRSIVGIEAETGTVLWEHTNKLHKGEPRKVNPNSAVYHDGCIFVTSRFVGGTQLKLSADGGSVTKVWDNESLDVHHGGVVVVDGYVYGANTKRNGWMCLDWGTGKVMYEQAWLGKGSVTYADGMLYCYEEKAGTVALVKASPKGFDIVSSFVVTGGTDEHWAHPVVCDGRLYVRHGDTLMVYDVKGGGS
jgi:outer membrane protein assembly factor BamB